MKPNRWQQVEQLYHSALEQEANQRADFLKAACAGDQALHREVESLLRLQPQAESFIEEPAVEAVAHVMAQSRTQSLVGRQIGSYQILSLLGVGGMGEVYKARDTRLDRIDALKILPSEVASDRERLRRFVREAKAASALKHPNVATIYEIGESAGLHFIAMEYVEGQTLESKISSQPLDPAEVVEIGLQITDALDEAHSKGITHRDIKPANLMLTPRGQVKVLDFGLAKVARPEGQAVASDITTDLSTASGVLMGTMHYMSPEQVLGQKPDHRTDIFSLGAVLYEMATGRLPFAGTSSTETMDRILHEQPEAMAQFNYNLPVELERIIRKCLEKDRERRYQSARELLIDLKNLKRDSALVAIPARRAKLVPVLGGLGAAVLAAALWYGISKLGRETDKPGKTLAHAAFTQLTNQPGEECFPSLSPDGRLVAKIGEALNRFPGGSHDEDTSPVAFRAKGNKIAVRREHALGIVRQ
jgi:tRNA A-37 threonylcarbamoyl transferase component Bud32